MKKILTIVLVLMTIGFGNAQSKKADKNNSSVHPKGVLDFTMKSIDGKPQPLASYKGNVLMIINTASECGYTPQYETLEKLYETYKDKGFQVLAFPANNFGAQEPGSNAEIKTFCSTKYHTTFDLFEKISVKGNDQDPLYTYITKESPYKGDIKWNFQKYLVDRSGNIAAKYMSAVDPMSKEVRDEVEKLLAK
ncbi:MAG TPA: glutathione peroxidase [Bacteroidota bacterium]|nr:glutathione peroxidase [Bacteroidota bacterium]